MLKLKSILARVLRRSNALPSNTCGVPRRRRVFDAEVIAPYDDSAIVAYMKADRLADLNAEQIRIFLLLLDQPRLQGLSASWIAEHLNMSRIATWRNLRALERKGYAMHAPSEPQARSGSEAGPTWFCDPDHSWSDPEELYAEFTLF